jgi:hypothetical protein
VVLILLAFVGFLSPSQPKPIERRYSQQELDEAYRSGKLSMETEATQLGLGRYDGTNFVWNSNIFKTYELALNEVIKSAQRADKIADMSVRVAKSTIQIGEIIKKLDENGYLNSNQLVNASIKEKL